MSLSSTVSNSIPSRTDMMAMPWSPIVPETRMRSPGRAMLIDSERPVGNDADAGGGDEDLVPLAAVDDLGVAGDQCDARPRRMPPRIDATMRSRSAMGKPFFENERRRQEERVRAADRQVVDRAVDRQLADVAARERTAAAPRTSRW